MVFSDDGFGFPGQFIPESPKPQCSALFRNRAPGLYRAADGARPGPARPGRPGMAWPGPARWTLLPQQRAASWDPGRTPSRIRRVPCQVRSRWPAPSGQRGASRGRRPRSIAILPNMCVLLTLIKRGARCRTRAMCRAGPDELVLCHCPVLCALCLVSGRRR